MRVWARALLIVVALEGSTGLPGALAQVPEAYRDGSSHYEDVAKSVSRLNVKPETGRDVACENSVYSANPCPEIVVAWKRFVEEHDLPRTRQTATMLQAYIARDYRKADRLYARSKGFALPDEPTVSTEAARDVAGLNVKRSAGRDTACSNDILSAKPCPAAVKAWSVFAKKHGLSLNRQTARMFEALVEGRTAEGNRLFASAKRQQQKPPANELHAEVRTYNVRRRAGLEVGECENNYYAVNPCLEAVRAWRDFTKKHGLAQDRRSANLFQAYVEDDPVTGDKLYAAAKGIPITKLLQDRGHDIVAPSANPLYVPIYPMDVGR
ncbi:MAG: hypothetical protein Kilf2KO_18310 [Rhodospirillales bacterium]